jgi:hypothetical protein
MLKGMRIRWQQQLLVAVLFCGAYLLVRHVSLVYFAHWMPQAGIWLGGVLLLPRRFWTALLAANVMALIPGAYACFDQYGWGGSLIHLIPISAFAMVVAWPLRALLPGTVSGKWVLESVTAKHMVALMGCIFVFALLTAADGTWQYALTFLPGQNGPALIRLWAPRYVLGNYLGCLTVVPLALAIHEAIRQADSWRGLVREMGRSRLLLEGVVLGLSCVGLLTAMGAGVAGDMWRQGARMALYLPVAWMAVRYGWQGAAVGGTAASIGIMLSMPAQYDPGIINAQNFMAIFLSVLLPLGAKINSLNEQERQLATDHVQVRQAAQREIYQGELRLRRGMEMQGQAHEYMQEGYGRLLERVRDVLPEKELHYFRTLLVLVQRFTSSVQESFLPAPWKWPRLGLLTALRAGAIADTLEECGITFDDHVSQRVTQLTPGAQWTLYRLACEAVAYTLMQSPATPCIRLYVRVAMVGPMRDIPWAMLVVVGEPEPPTAPPLLIALPKSSHLLLSRLGAMGLDLAGMRDRASLYQGRLRSNRRWQRLSVSLLDSPDVKLDTGHAGHKDRRAVCAA